MPGPTTSGKTQGDFIEQGVRLREALSRGQAAFDETVRNEGLKPRKAYYIVSIADTFERSPVPREELLAVGWTKLEMLRDRADDPDFPELVRQARQLPVSELRRVLSGAEARGDRHVVTLYLTPDQFEVLAEVVSRYGGGRDGRTLHNREHALTLALKELQRRDAGVE